MYHNYLFYKLDWLRYGQGYQCNQIANPDHDEQAAGAGGQPPAPVKVTVDMYAKYEVIFTLMLTEERIPLAQICGKYLHFYYKGAWEIMETADEAAVTANLRRWLETGHLHLARDMKLQDYKEVYELLKRDTRFLIKRFPLRSFNAVAFDDYTLDLKTGFFREHRPEDYLTVRLPYKAEQIINPPEPKYLPKLLNTVAGRNEDMYDLVMGIGFLAITHYPFKKAVIFYGPQDTGKSLLVSLYRALFEDTQPTIPHIEGIDDRFSMQTFKGASIVTSGDYSGEKFTEKAVAIFKQLVGMDPIAYDVKHRMGGTIEDKPLLVINANEKIQPEQLRNDTAAYSRLWQIPVLTQPPKKDPELLQKILLHDMPFFIGEIMKTGIRVLAGKLNLEEGYERVAHPEKAPENKNGVSSSDTSGEEEARPEMEDLSEKQVATRRFTESCTEICAGARTATSALYAAAKDFDGYFTEMDVAQFGKLLRQAFENVDGVKYITPGNFRGFAGIRLSNRERVTPSDVAE